MQQEQKVIIDNKEYLKSELPQQALIQIGNLQATEQEIARQEAQLAMLKTARSAYANLLAEALKETTAKKSSTTKTTTKKAATVKKAATNKASNSKAPAKKAASKAAATK